MAGTLSGCSLEDLRAICQADPGDDTAHSLYAAALQSACYRARSAGGAPCGCGSGTLYRGCCQARDRRGLRRFADRRPLYRLRDDLMSYFDNPDFESTRRIARQTWFGDGMPGAEARLPDLEDGCVEVLFAYEWAFSLLPVHWDDDPDDCLLQCYSHNPGTPPEAARRARAWKEHGRFGLWQCSYLQEPGTWLTDLLTGMCRYVNVAPEQMEPLDPPAVLVGQILPLEGIWRMAGTIAIVSLETAAGLAEAILELRSQVLEGSFQAERRGKAGQARQAPLPPPQEVGRLTSALVGTILPLATPTPEPSSVAPGR